MRFLFRWSVLCLLVSSAACSRSAQQTPAPPSSTSTASSTSAPPETAAKTAPVHAVFHNVNFRIAADVTVEIRDMEGSLVATRPGQIAAFDDPNSFTIAIDTGEVAISPASLTNLLRSRIFPDDTGPLRHVEVSIEDGELEQKGKLHKGVDVPFSMKSEVSVTPQGEIRLHPTSVKAVGIPAGGLMKLFGLQLDEVVKLNPTPGIRIQDDDFLLDPSKLLPAPGISGHVTSVRIEGDRLVQSFGQSAKPPTPQKAGKALNYMHFSSGTLRFGRLTMRDVDLQIVDANPADPLDFFLARYNEQLAAGYSTSSLEGALTVHVPDYARAAGVHLRPR